jgi:hypothetical protein
LFSTNKIVAALLAWDFTHGGNTTDQKLKKSIRSQII